MIIAALAAVSARQPWSMLDFAAFFKISATIIVEVRRSGQSPSPLPLHCAVPAAYALLRSAPPSPRRTVQTSAPSVRPRRGSVRNPPRRHPAPVARTDTTQPSVVSANGDDQCAGFHPPAKRACMQQPRVHVRKRSQIGGTFGTFQFWRESSGKGQK